MGYLAVAIAAFALGGGIGWHLGIDRARERAGREAFSPEVEKWTAAKWPKPEA
jgi:membrane protein YqaA with SNARE-associated domain